MLLIIIYISILVYTTTIFEMVNGFEKLLRPLKKLKINAGFVALAITLILRFIPNLIDQMPKVKRISLSRGIDYQNKNIKDKFKNLKLVILSMVNLTLKESIELKNTMNLRCFNPNMARTSYKKYNYRELDVFLLGTHIFILLSFIVKVVFGWQGIL